jgi:hypothetical protein
MWMDMVHCCLDDDMDLNVLVVVQLWLVVVR